MTNLTPAQLEEFESAFRHFDRDRVNALNKLQFAAALASLGVVYDDQEMDEIFLLVRVGDVVTFESFIRFMVEITQDQHTAQQVLDSFYDVAEGKTFVTELDLQRCQVPQPMIDKLKEMMPAHPDGGLDYEEYMMSVAEDPDVDGEEKYASAFI